MAKNYFKPNWKAIVKALNKPEHKNEMVAQFTAIKTRLDQEEKITWTKQLSDEMKSLKVKLISIPKDTPVFYAAEGPMFGKVGKKIKDGNTCMYVDIEGKSHLLKYENLSIIKPEKRRKSVDYKL